jgi:hypothetical protein
MNGTLFTVALTVFILGLVAAFGVIPGAGLYAGASMILIGATLAMVSAAR